MNTACKPRFCLSLLCTGLAALAVSGCGHRDNAAPAAPSPAASSLPAPSAVSQPAASAMPAGNQDAMAQHYKTLMQQNPQVIPGQRK